MDYGRLRAAALAGTDNEEAVTVDTRALIDKVLARYSGEWTTLRELIQNAADAQATTVAVRFETMPSIHVPLPSNPSQSDLLKHVVANHTLKRLVVRNDGQTFTKTDWGRLKRIAEGNPDETKIGAFGVGFYSVFADCEEPFVSSGNEAMAFYWKGNSLFTKKSQLPPDQTTPNTTFVLDYRNTTSPVPNILSVCQFLATSLTFVALEKIEFWLDDFKLLDLHKKISPSVNLPIPPDFDVTTHEKMMTICAVERMGTQIDASYMSAIGWKPKSSAGGKSDSGGQTADVPLLKSWFARLAAGPSQSSTKAKEETAAQVAIAEDITAIKTKTIFLGVTNAQVKTLVSPAFSSELQRATKKPPPKIARLAILTSSYDESMASAEAPSSDAVSKATDVFANVLPGKKPGGRVFIGFPTMQTTGGGLHISAPSVIPTVEREAIDLNARWVRTWNQEMLRAAGIITRLTFADDMKQLSARLLASVPPKGKLTNKEVAKFMPVALHILKTYTFGYSTPSAQVGVIIEEAFWTCYKRPVIDVYSTRGVLPTSRVRIPSEELSKFVDGLATIPDEMKDHEFVNKLIEFGLITRITMSDIHSELSAKAMTKEQLTHFIQWLAKNSLNSQLDMTTTKGLLNVAVATVDNEDGSGNQGEIVALGTIKTFLATSHKAPQIPPTMPMPPDTLPFALSNTCSTAELTALGWRPLEIFPWLDFVIKTSRHRSDDLNMFKSDDFSIRVLAVVSKGWDNQSAQARSDIAALLREHAIMPTKFGMRKPGDSFFPSVKLFDDLPVIQGSAQLKDKFLAAIGVRKTLDLDTIFARLLSSSTTPGENKWSHVELIKYLASVKDDIPSADLKKLKEWSICPAEDGPGGKEGEKAKTRLYKVSELFEPQDTFRALRLPVLQWPGTLGSRSAEAMFLSSLGLRPYPSAPELINIMAGPDAMARDQAMTYFISKHVSNGYGSFDIGSTTKAFLPVEGSSKLVSPSGCFTDEGAAALDFKLLRRNLHVHALKFGVARSPPITDCVNRLIVNPPLDKSQAVRLFGYFSQRIPDLKENSKAKLRNAAIVPIVPTGEKGNVRFAAPSACYLGGSSTYADIFDYVDFGEANAFLFHCGARSEPTKLELAERVCSEPARLLGMLQVEKYLNLLRSLAMSSSELKRDKKLWSKMCNSPFLLAWKTVVSGAKEDVDLDEDEAVLKQYQLAAPSQIVVPDDFISYRIFQELLLCAPEDEALENFYMALGARPLTRLVQEDLNMGPQVDKKDRSTKLRKHVIERAKIFLHEYASDKKEIIRRDAKWLEKNLTVTIVQSISLRRRLQNHNKSHSEKRSAASNDSRDGCILYVTADGQLDMYQIGQAMCPVLLKRHSQQSYLFFEPFLTLDLLGLRSRGYNVERILRAKEAQARVAEEERRKVLEEERKRIREREAEWVKSQNETIAATAREEERGKELKKQRDSLPAMPGAFGNDDDDDGTSPNLPWVKKGRGLFESLTRRFGLDEQPDSADTPRGPTPTPPVASGSGSGSQPQPGRPEGTVTNPALVLENLVNAVGASRPYGSNELYSQPQVNEVKEQSTYCDSTSSKDIVFAAEASNRMKVFVDKKLQGPVADRLLATNGAAVNAFASMLVEVGAIYNVSPSVLHIFHDEEGLTIAFNKGGAMFFNLRFYLQLHAGGMASPMGRSRAMVWWWVVMAHELAHNLVLAHTAEHSYYTESFIQEYFFQLTNAEPWHDEDGGARPAWWVEQDPYPPSLPHAPEPTTPLALRPHVSLPPASPAYGRLPAETYGEVDAPTTEASDRGSEVLRQAAAEVLRRGGFKSRT
ncbi:related to NUO-14 NADH2 dehydrogenase (ubiquinone) 14K chain [Cephalotrichum gorgonifer]|uniref:Related to NUO-14 NADH2 dehydrogenase (Ubiquinone) 14K chain n=1 Tax=Cephalotrichum gorgonifer TaxID=2041049 RepID=A0AAE8MQK2_9PEZI|nr:related to NUO-14 NADH2 dehydrogenase (ubiquinone) 14K chain [Cephalotrichum gorgonifer]